MVTGEQVTEVMTEYNMQLAEVALFLNFNGLRTTQEYF